ncbi:MAG: hypothetical protein LC794_08360 [Acidobacteria bacterium]|nr:hypothetical protein [Acidobacteriota bacterium]
MGISENAIVNDRSHPELMGQLRPTALTKAIQHSGHFGMIASTRVDATEKPMLVDERVMGNLQ